MSINNGINEETILHVWNWSFKTIKENIKEIVKSGYTWIQVSPIQGTKDDRAVVEDWWILYQPVNFKIGNKQIGSRDEFIQMCNEAHKYGLKVMVDIILNHTASKGGGNESYIPHEKVDILIRDDINFWHERRGVENWSDRWQVTHWGIGLPDLNTSNHMLQNIMIDFLNDVIKCGADGLRFDAAKHIELPDDPGGSDFWPRVLGSLINHDKLLLYGEVLQSGASNYEKYCKYMRVSAEGYSYAIRKTIGYNSEKNINNAKEYQVPYGVKPSDLITWVESHDDYASSREKSSYLTNWQIKMAWAIIASRSESIPLFFNRPKGNGWLEGKIGEKGDDLWKSPEIVAINKFRQAMKGEKENIITLGNNLMITERGNKGVIIINLGDEYYIDNYTQLEDGIYIDKITGKGFNVFNGRLIGAMPARKIAILYDCSKNPCEDCEMYFFKNKKVYFRKPLDWGWPKIYIYKENVFNAVELSPWPGTDMNKESNELYSYHIDDYWINGNIIFNDVINQLPGKGNEGFLITQIN